MGDKAQAEGDRACQAGNRSPRVQGLLFGPETLLWGGDRVRLTSFPLSLELAIT